MANKEINFLIDLTKDIIEIIKREIQVIDFWESYSKQKQLRYYIISHLLKKIPKQSRTERYITKEPPMPYSSQSKGLIFKRRNEIAQKLMELAYHIYGK